jgi:hypothetical protein
MAPLTRPDLINPLVTAFLGAPANNEGMIEVGGGRVQNDAEAIPSLNACNEPDTA